MSFSRPNGLENRSPGFGFPFPSIDGDRCTEDHSAAKPQPIATRYRRVGVWACRRDCRGNALTVTNAEYPNRNLARLRPTASLPRNPNLCDLCGLLCKILIRSQLQPGVTTQRVVRLCTAAQRAEESLPHYWPPVTLTSNNLQKWPPKNPREIARSSTSVIQRGGSRESI